jgi:DHA1 family bicyclomycin/chloramphenicol resistance-like MFS transporter
MTDANISAPRPSIIRDALILGLVTAIGPFAVDMYLPSLPLIGASLNTSPDSALLSMTAFFITFALGQLIFGPVSDIVGRKPPLYFGIALFAATSVGCALSQDITTLIAFRAIQGLGGAAGIVIPRAVVRDLHSGVDEARLLSLLMLVFSVSPLVAPLVGSQVAALLGWRAVFWLVTGLALLGLLLLVFSVRETRPRELRTDSSIGSVLSACRLLLFDGKFMGLTFIGAFAISGFFVFLANSSFIMMGHYHLSPTEYSLVFSANAAAFFFATQFNGWLGGRYGLQAIMRPAMFGYGAAIALMFALSQAGVDNFFLLGGCLFISNAFLGLVLPVSSVLALADHGPIAGTASSLMSTLQLTLGAAVMAISGTFANGTAGPMIDAIAVCGLAAFVLGQVTLRRNGAAHRVPEASRG